jgi:hypothetical protein
MKSIISPKSNFKFYTSNLIKMSIQRVYTEFEVLMNRMAETHECAHRNIEDTMRSLMRVTVNSCASMYGFSAEEALKRLNSDGEIIELPVVVPIQQKELEKAEKLRLKEAEKAEKLRLKEAEKAEKLRRKEYEIFKKNQLKALEESEKANESSERYLMKDEDISSKASEKLALKEAEKLAKETEKALKEAEKVEKLRLKEAEKALKKSEKPAKKVKKVKNIKVDDESDVSTVIMTDSEDEEPHVLFQNISLINEINSIRDVKKFKNFKKLSAGVKLARQIMDI